MYLNQCKPRQHAYKFLGNKKFTKASYGPGGNTVTMSIRALYRCEACGKESRRSPRHDQPGAGL